MLLVRGKHYQNTSELASELALLLDVHELNADRSTRHHHRALSVWAQPPSALFDRKNHDVVRAGIGRQPAGTLCDSAVGDERPMVMSDKENGKGG